MAQEVCHFGLKRSFKSNSWLLRISRTSQFYQKFSPISHFLEAACTVFWQACLSRVDPQNSLKNARLKRHMKSAILVCSIHFRNFFSFFFTFPRVLQRQTKYLVYLVPTRCTRQMSHCKLLNILHFGYCVRFGA